MYYTNSIFNFPKNVKGKEVFVGLFSFKNYQLMSVTESLHRRSGFASLYPTYNTGKCKEKEVYVFKIFVISGKRWMNCGCILLVISLA